MLIRFRWLLALLLAGVGSLMAAAIPPQGNGPGPQGQGRGLRCRFKTAGSQCG
jgi:hypothetical protein